MIRTFVRHATMSRRIGPFVVVAIGFIGLGVASVAVSSDSPVAQIRGGQCTAARVISNQEIFDTTGNQHPYVQVARESGNSSIVDAVGPILPGEDSLDGFRLICSRDTVSAIVTLIRSKAAVLVNVRWRPKIEVQISDAPSSQKKFSAIWTFKSQSGESLSVDPITGQIYPIVITRTVLP